MRAKPSGFATFFSVVAAGGVGQETRDGDGERGEGLFPETGIDLPPSWRLAVVYAVISTNFYHGRCVGRWAKDFAASGCRCFYFSSIKTLGFCFSFFLPPIFRRLEGMSESVPAALTSLL